MINERDYGNLDIARMIAALFVVCIHTSPLASLSQEADFLLTRIIARVAVPFFLMTTGFFVLSPSLFNKGGSSSAVWRFTKKTALLYAISTAFYFPVSLYAGRFHQVRVWDILRDVLFDGTFYHLWYLPASILGALVLLLLSRKLRFRHVFAISLFLYCVGLMGDSYFGAAARIPAIASVYQAAFRLFTYTRNGLFYAPVFLALGAWLGQGGRAVPEKILVPGLVLSLTLMIAEGLILRQLSWPRHDSMYVFLTVCSFFAFSLLISRNTKPNGKLRTLATWVYLLHPLCIVLVRGAAKATRTTEFLVENSMIHFFAVVLLSVVFSLLINALSAFQSGKRFPQVRAWIELDRRALSRNVSALRALLPEGCALMAVVKADAYGHGAALIARELNALGIKSFCVASALEGADLRKNRIRGEILVLGYTHPAQFRLLRRYHLTQTVIDSAYAALLDGYGKPFTVQIALDTGMHRLGEPCERIGEIQRMFQYRNFKISGVYSHLCADDTASPKDRAFTLLQAQRLQQTVSLLRAAGCACGRIHLQASYGLLNYPELSGDVVRAGIALYGVLSTPADTARCAVPLEPVLSLKARVTLIRTLRMGEAVGYGLLHVAKRDSKIAVLSIGYADGLPRSLSCGIGGVLINGQRVPIIGCICMDQTLVDITDIPNVLSGDIAVLIGRSGEREITACDLAEQAGTISNEILSRLGKRLERIVVP